MTLSRLLVGLACLAVFPGVAQAHTTIVEPVGSHFPYQQWVDEAKVPTPNVTLTVEEEGCPGAEAPACTEPGAYTIWDAAEYKPRKVFYHELGHNFDYYVLPEWARVRFSRLTGNSRDWSADPSGPNEMFAEAYARCAITGPDFRGDPNLMITGNLGGIRQTTYRAICRLILRFPQ